MDLQQKIDKLNKEISYCRANRNNKSRLVGKVLKIIALETQLVSEQFNIYKENKAPARKQKKRTDIHRRSVIIPEDYKFVAMRVGDYLQNKDSVWLHDQQEKIKKHMEKTGGKYATDSVCNCDICGALHTASAVFYHEKSNEYIKAGETCSEKLGQKLDFKYAKRQAELAEEERREKNRILSAFEILTEAGLSQSVEIFTFFRMKTEEKEKLNSDYKKCSHHNLCTVTNIVDTVAKKQELSEKQISYLKHLIDKINQDRLKPDPIPVPDEGTMQITGKIIGVKWITSDYGDTLKMTVIDNRGFYVFTTIPSSLMNEVPDGANYEGFFKGREVVFTSNIEKSEKTELAYGKRPRKASFL